MTDIQGGGEQGRQGKQGEKRLFVFTIHPAKFLGIPLGT